MSYRLTRDGLDLEISPGVDHDHVYITIGSDDESCIFAAWHEDAPAVALAILEATGINDDSAPTLASAYGTLRRHVETQARDKEREAEDAKVDEYRRVVLAEDVSRMAIRAWNIIAPETQDMWRRKYRAAREFFAKEDTPAPRVLQYGTPAPRVLQYGAPEPERDTRWRDRMGDIWFYGAKSWKYARPDGTVSESDYHRWDELATSIFPMTEVTGDARRSD